jgi:LysM repeat protein
MRNSFKYIFIVLIVLLYSCSASRKASRTVVTAGSVPSYAAEYLNRYGALAVSEMRRTGIPASITLAQGMLESDYGRSSLARKSNNHFGIKCHNDWQGKTVYHDDNRRGECFRAYSSAEDSFRDHSDFLVNGSRYRDLFKLSSTDYKSWAHGLKKAGYATDPAYPAQLIKKIEDYRLHAYDIGQGAMPAAAQQVTTTQVNPQAAVQITSQSTLQTNPSAIQPATSPAKAQKEPDTTQVVEEMQVPIKVISLNRSRVMENNKVQYIIAEGGDTFESLAEEFQLLTWEISRYNDLAPGADLQPGQIVYLQPKRNRAAEGKTIHIVKDGDTMYSISQKYAVKLSSLYKMNVMKEGTECVPGQKVRIR